MSISKSIGRRGAPGTATATAPDRDPAAPPPIGKVLANLRQRAGLSLDGLSRQSGVSKSMLSQIERGKTNPTIAVVWRLAKALNVEPAEFLGNTTSSNTSTIQLVSSAQTPLMRSPDGKHELRILSPVELAGRFEWYELTLKPGGTLQSEPHENGVREHLTVLDGQVSIRSANQIQLVNAKQTARYSADVPHSIKNEGKTEVTALLIVMHAAG